MKQEIKWAAELSHVREVSLLGTADGAFWTRRLRDEGLTLALRDGRAQVMIVAADSKYMGVRFREMSISLLASDGADQGAYLVQAWNSCRFFAFCERTFFATPYAHGEVQVSTAAPVRIHVAEKGRGLFVAEMRGTEVAGVGRLPASRGEGGWSGPVFLPRKRKVSGRAGKWFRVRITGQTETFPFCRDIDALTMDPGSGSEPMAALVDSRFNAEQWLVRADATHAKSRTYRRGR